MLEGEVLYGAHHTGKSISYGKLGVGYGKVHGYTAEPKMPLRHTY